MVYQFSALSDGQSISFNPGADVLNFDQTSIAAADIRVSTSGTSTRIDVIAGPQAGKDILLLNTAPLQLATSNVTFANGSLLLFGDNSTLQGDNNSNTLNSGAGRDLIMGFGGSDTINLPITGYGTGDFIDGGTGFDSLVFTGTTVANLVIDFAAGTISGGGGSATFTGIERMVAGNGADSLSGDALNQILTGANGNDTLWGAGGNDTLWGGGHADTFVFRETGTANADSINDFTSGLDKISLDAAVMSALGSAGQFSAGDSRFAANSTGTAQDTSDRVVYNTTTRQLFYDADGNGAGAAQLIATLQSGATLAATDIVVSGSGGGGGGGATAGNDSLVGTPGNDTIDGLAGNDTIDGLAGNDLLIGSDGDDVLIAMDGFDTVNGGAGFDTQIMRGGLAGAGIEQIILRDYGISGADGHGNELDNIIKDEGPGGDVWLYGNGGNDTLIGGSGPNRFVFSGNPSGSSDAYGNDSVDGGGGIDWLIFENNDAAVTVDFRNGTVTGGSTVPASVTFVNVEAAQGTLHNDVLIAGSTGNTLGGYGGNDTLTGGAGNDNLSGDSGFGHPTGDFGNDSLFGGAGNDSLGGEEGSDSLDGGLGNDWLSGGGGDLSSDGPDSFFFTVAPGAANADQVADLLSGSDRIVLDGNTHANIGESGNFAPADARFFAGAGANAGQDTSDRVVYNTTTGQLWYDADGNGTGFTPQLIATLQGAPALTAADIYVINGTSGVDRDGTAGNDSLTGTSGNDLIRGLGGNDTIEGLAGDDILQGGEGTDSLVGGDGDDRLSGDSPFDVVLGNDFIDGGAGNDYLQGWEGDDTLLGGAGDDYFNISSDDSDFSSDQTGDDSIDGGSGIDSIAFANQGRNGTPAVIIDLLAGTYRVGGPTPASGIVVNVENVTGSWESDRIKGTNSANSLDGLYGSDTIEGLGGDDILSMLGGNAVLLGGTGNDTITAESGVHTFAGGEGNDSLAQSGGADSLSSSFLFDVAPGAANADTIAFFEVRFDKIVLDGNAYQNIGASGNFSANDARFFAGAGANSAQDSSDRVVYNTTSGQLWYDADGTGTGFAPQLIATLQGAPAPILAATDISIVNGSGSGGATAGNDSLVGTEGPDTIDGVAGNDTIRGLGGDDWLIGGEGNDSVIGGAGNDTLVGAAGDDTLDGGLGADRMEGGANRDVYIVDDQGDIVVEFVDGGIDLVLSSLTAYTLPAWVNDLTLTGVAEQGLGNELDNVLTGNAEANFLHGYEGNDSIIGGGGNDSQFGGGGNDSLNGGDGADFVDGSEGDDTLFGGLDNDLFYFQILAGTSFGNDVIDGGGGADWLDFSGPLATPGGVPFNGLIINLATGSVTSRNDSGTGTVSFGSIENVYGSWSSDHIVGDGGSNFLDGGSGGDGFDTIDGGMGNDTLAGGLGDDQFVFSTSAGGLNVDVVTDFSSGSDRLVFDGNAYANLGPSGNFTSGDARFFAGPGATSGQDASDRLVYNTTFGQLWYDADGNGSGAAQLIASLQGAPDLKATDISVINGSSGGVHVVGTAGNDSLVGGPGNDTLEGLGGADTLVGQGGDDTYLVGTGDVLSDSSGNDTAFSNVSFGLGPTSNVETLVLTGTASIGAQGNNQDNVLIGNDAANTINGRAGNDSLVGNGGNDVFDISAGGTTSYGNDTIDGGAGVDTLDYIGSSALSALVVDLAAGTATGGNSTMLVTNVERVYAGGFADRIVGNSAANTFIGQGGNDTLAGAGGLDTLTGSAGNDSFDFTTAPAAGNADRIVDFVSGTDKLRFDDAVHSGIGATGNFAAGDARFWAGTAAHDASDRIVYNQSTGSLYYDADGNGAGAAVLVATFQGNPAITATDLVVI